MNRIRATIDCATRYQAIDGWGVNINSKYWDDGRLVPVMEMLIDDLGATIFRQDACGKSNWVDPENRLRSRSLSAANYRKIYSGIDFANAAGMGRYLNSRGIEPYLCLSGIIPKWMCARDARTMKNYSAFGEMAASYAAWMRRDAGVRFRLFGPLNETDLGPPEGPYVGPNDYTMAAEAMIAALDRHGLGDVKLVVPETAGMEIEYFRRLIKSRRLAGRIAVFGLHTYGTFNARPIMDLVRMSPFRHCHWWMTEYGDLDQTGEKEWYVAWVSYRRLMELLRQGFSAALNWDAYDNYHDHDESWSIYGLVRWGIRDRTPKKRFYSSKQMYRFVRPGYVRVAAVSAGRKLPVLAFTSPDGNKITLTGMNEMDRPTTLSVHIRGARPKRRRFIYYRTSVSENCVRVATIAGKTTGKSEIRLELTVPSKSIFTVTTLSTAPPTT